MLNYQVSLSSHAIFCAGIVLVLSLFSCENTEEILNQASQAQAAYSESLEQFQEEYGGSRELPAVNFFLFGMGDRPKLLYRRGVLSNVLTGEIIDRWDPVREIIIPPEYRVVLHTADDMLVQIREDSAGIWLRQNGETTLIAQSDAPVTLPSFNEYDHSEVLRVLHQEILVNIIDGAPVPNLFVYNEPWYRDGAMAAMCLAQTGNLPLLEDWITGLRDPYDYNNADEAEADNLGEVLYLISLAADSAHPLVDSVLNEVEQYEVRDSYGTYIRGRTDFNRHPVYQTKWLKFGLEALSMDDPYYVPLMEDTYSSLFWMGFRGRYLGGNDADDTRNYPYLGWASDHFHRYKRSPISDRPYPLTWEAHASQAEYSGMAVVDTVYAEAGICAPHIWHAAEVFLYLTDLEALKR
ncbi:MAG TPA: hypothetical protein VKA68_14635 [bacterium]|nr:hypothetical protein [bacterium]